MKNSQKTIFIVELIFSVVLSPSVFVFPSVFAAEDEEELKEDITSTEKKLEREKKEKAILESKLSTITKTLSATERAILATEAAIEATEDSLERKALEIKLLEERILEREEYLSEMLRNLYASPEDLSLPYFLSDGKTFEDEFAYGEDMLSLGEKLEGVIQEIESERVETEGQKNALEDEKEEHEKLLRLKAEQKADLVQDKNETQSDIKEQQATIAELESKLDKLKGDLSKLLGKSYNAKDIEDAAAFAAKKTGVRKDFLMGMLVVESNLGRYTGGCTYGEVESGAEARYKAKKLSKASWATFQRRRDIFKQIAKELDKDYKKLKVSCNPSGYTGTGGAMGVPQFMPDTWMGYKSSIARETGHNPPDPWNLTDGVMAMALKLAKVPGVTKGEKSAEKNAAKIYLSGTTSSRYNWYGDKVLYWADNYERLLK